MKVGDLVRVKQFDHHTIPIAECDWVGIITGFRIDADLYQPDARYAVVFWNEQYPEEEEYLEQIEVINENR